MCWSDILDAKNWLPPETWMIDVGVNWFAQRLKTDIGKFMLFEDIQPFFFIAKSCFGIARIRQ